MDGQVYRRMRFYVQGSNGEGTVHVEVKMDGKPEYRYLFVEVPGAYRTRSCTCGRIVAEALDDAFLSKERGWEKGALGPGEKGCWRGMGGCLATGEAWDRRES